MQPPSALIPFFWSPGWNSIQAVNKFQTKIGAELAGGDPGVRLIEPVAGEARRYFTSIPAAFERRSGEWLVVPLHHIFGSEELSNAAPAVAELAPRPYLALNEGDARQLGANLGDEVEAKLGNLLLQFKVKVIPELPSGVAGIPVGLPGEPTVELPAWSRISKCR